MKLRKDQLAPWGKELYIANTGDWKEERPVIQEESCKNCGVCWLVCPTSCIRFEEGSGFRIELAFCKGCGLCAEECPLGAIRMEREERN